MIFFFSDTATTEIYTLSLHDALPISLPESGRCRSPCARKRWSACRPRSSPRDRKSTRLNSSHGSISYAVFCLKKKKDTKTNHGEDEVYCHDANAAARPLTAARELWTV